MLRRIIFAFGLVACTWLALVSTIAPASAQTNWPERTVKVIVPYAPGGASDLIARPWADKLSQAFGQQFVIENRGGASGMIGTEAAAKSPADGYTLLMTPNNPLTILPNLRQMPYDAVKSFDPVGRIGDMVCGFVINPALGIKTFQEMLDFARKNPGKLAYGSSGLGTNTQMRLEMLKLKTGVDILHVPYRGGAETLTDVLANNVQMMNELAELPHVKAGKLIMLNVNHPTRHPDFPDVPTLTELGINDADVPNWFAAYAPAGTPRDIINKLNAKIVEIAKSPEMIATMIAIGATIPIATPDEVVAHMAADTKRNAELIKAASIKLE